jgi:hypothetical protein
MAAKPSDMATITFDGTKHELTVDGKTYTAYNNIDSQAKGKWPNGTYAYERHTDHSDEDSNGSYGPGGNHIFKFEDNSRTNMGIHAGRKDKKGPAHPTMGCIRTTDEGVKAVGDYVAAKKKKVQLVVENN